VDRAKDKELFKVNLIALKKQDKKIIFIYTKFE